MMTPGGIGGQREIQKSTTEKPVQQQPTNKTGDIPFGEQPRFMTWKEGVSNAYDNFMEMDSSERTLEAFLKMIFQPFFTPEGFKAYEQQQSIIFASHTATPHEPQTKTQNQDKTDAVETNASVQTKPQLTPEQKIEVAQKKIDELEVAREKAFNLQETHLKTMERLSTQPNSNKLFAEAKSARQVADANYAGLTRQVQDDIQELFKLEKLQGLTQPSRKIKDLITPQNARKKVADLQEAVNKAHADPIFKSKGKSPERTAAIAQFNELNNQLRIAQSELNQIEQK